MIRQPQFIVKTPRDLPAIDKLLASDGVRQLIDLYGRDSVLQSLRETVSDIRSQLLSRQIECIVIGDIIDQLREQLADRAALSLRSVINATGVILHTNLGRAPISMDAIEVMQSVASSYSNLEFDLQTGKRGKRTSHIEDLVAATTGAEAAMVVNNAAAALVLTLSALAKNREVIISRGQLIEIGGGFRIPDVMTQSGAKLVEVGTTNRTRLADYESAITEQTAVLLRAHSSNFRMIGFIEETPLCDLAVLAHRQKLLMVDDLGSGALLDTADYGLSHEPTVQESIAAGADVVIFSGDKLLGGPQAGLIVGKASVLSSLKTHPLARALRVDKLTTAALAMTLQHYQRGQAPEKVPVWQMISQSSDAMRSICQRWSTIIAGNVLEGESTVGGGSLPGEVLPTVLFSPHVNVPQDTQTWLRERSIPIIARINSERLLLDPRTVLPHQLGAVEDALHDLAQLQL
jgi:L-seryl-tRNA(Ser) seleniumtransferase